MLPIANMVVRFLKSLCCYFLPIYFVWRSIHSANLKNTIPKDCIGLFHLGIEVIYFFFLVVYCTLIGYAIARWLVFFFANRLLSDSYNSPFTFFPSHVSTFTIAHSPFTQIISSHTTERTDLIVVVSLFLCGD